MVGFDLLVKVRIANLAKGSEIWLNLFKRYKEDKTQLEPEERAAVEW